MSTRDVGPMKPAAAKTRLLTRAPGSAPPIVHEVLRSPGQPLDAQTRSFFEPRFGHDFSKVRVHADERAHESARSVNGLAYTVGNDLVFGAGHFAPHTKPGQRLLAHELTHVVQQSQGLVSTPREVEVGAPNDTLEREADRFADAIAIGGAMAATSGLPPRPSQRTRALVQRQTDPTPQPVEQHETKSLIVERAALQKAAKTGYWWETVQEAYQVGPVPSRLVDDEEEKDAVLSVLWQSRPKGKLDAATFLEVIIPARPGKPDSKPLLYRFQFVPRDKPDAQDEVNIEFVAEGGNLTAPIVVAQAPAGYTPTIGYSYVNFPDNNNIAKYWNAHPEEKRFLLYWVEKQAPATFDQTVITEVVTKQAGQRSTNHTWFKVKGGKDRSGTVTSLLITFLSEMFPLAQAVPADYQAKDYGNALVEQAQAKADPKTNDKLGNVTIPPSVPTDERMSVKFYVAQYFTVIGTRNAEVDAVIPIPNKTVNVFYTFRFRPNNDVDVERVGEQGTDAKAGQVDPNKLDVARSPEYAAQSKDVATFSSWLKHRYPKVSVTGRTVDELRENINKEAESKADKPDWFKNYNLNILDDKQGETRLMSVHRYEKPRVKDMKVFLSDELKRLESLLETMTRKILGLLQFVSMTRQRIAIDKKVEGKNVTFVENPNLGGLTLTMGPSKTILIFDQNQGDPSQFLGGKEGVLPQSVFIYGHELGHIVGNTGVQRQFNQFVKKKNIKPMTRYAQTGGEDKGGPEKEFFPEAFALFQTDPEWMRTNSPELYAWFDTLVKTGQPPRP